MNKCFIVTTLLLVYLIAFVDSMVSYKCEYDEENSGTKPDLRFKLPNDSIADTKSMKEYFCNVETNEHVKTLQCDEREHTYPTSTSASSTAKKQNSKSGEKRYTLTEIILVALCCLLTGILLTILVFVLNKKRRMIVCFSKHLKDIQCDSKQKSVPGMQFPTESCVVKKNDPTNPKSADSKNENKAEETQYHSFNSNQVVNDQQIYDEIIENESRSDRHGHNEYQIDQIPNLQHNNEDVYEYFRDGDIVGYNYFVLERENMSRESRARNLGLPETDAEMGDEDKD